MPEYNPTLHEPITISLQEYDFFQRYTSIESDTFGNAYKSAIKAGYSHYYARVITHYIPLQRLRELKRLYDDPHTQSLLQLTREQENDLPSLSYSKWKRLTAVSRQEAKAVMIELDNMLGTVR